MNNLIAILRYCDIAILRYCDYFIYHPFNISIPYLPQKKIPHSLCHFANISGIMRTKGQGTGLKIAEYTGDILLVGINYDKETKQHTCKIERMSNVIMEGNLI